MKIITKTDQDRATAYFMQIISAIKSNDDMELLQSLVAVAELAYIVGGIPMMETLEGGIEEIMQGVMRDLREEMKGADNE